MNRVAVAAVALLVFATGCGEPSAQVAMVPSSFTALTAAIDRERGVETEWVIAGSSRLVAQLADGATADLLITADAETMQRAIDDGLVEASLGVIARNRLVLAVAPDNPGTIAGAADLADPDRLIGVCAAEVPCGRLAGSAAEALGIEIAADSEEPNVRSLALKIARGELDGGLIYATDALGFALDTVDDEAFAAHVNEYHAASVSGSMTGVVDFLRSPEGRALFTEHGFLLS